MLGSFSIRLSVDTRSQPHMVIQSVANPDGSGKKVPGTF